MMILFVQLMHVMKRLFKNYLQKPMKKAIFIKLNMKVGIVHLANPSGLNKNLVKITHVQIVAVL